jgi:hypothetical protein
MSASDSELGLLNEEELDTRQKRPTPRAAKSASTKATAQSLAATPKKSNPSAAAATKPKAQTQQAGFGLAGGGLLDDDLLDPLDGDPLGDGLFGDDLLAEAAQAEGSLGRAPAANHKLAKKQTSKRAPAAAAGLASAGAQQKSAAQGDAAEEESEEKPRRGFAILRGAPSWLVSGIVHLVAFVILALIAMPNAPNQLKELFVAGEISEEPEEIEIFEPVQIEPENLETQQLADATMQSEDMGMANLGDVATIPTSVEGITTADVDSTLENIGMLFGQDGRGMAQSDVGMGGAEFFGVKSGGRKFVFLVDSSKSMGGGRFEDACEELQYAIRKLSKDQYFYVIFFDWNAEGMIFAPSTEPETRAAAATSQNINKVEKWISTVQLELKTDPYEAMRLAMEMMPDAIYLLTDGIFSGKTEPFLNANNRIYDDPDSAYLRINVENDKRGEYYRPKVVIHTVGFYSDQGKDLLQRIAKQYGGTYRFVPQPAKKKK